MKYNHAAYFCLERRSFPVNVDYFRKLVDYNYWAHRRVWDCVTPLTEAQFTQPHDYSMGSLHRQLVHTMEIEWLWLRRIQGEREAKTTPATAYPSRESIRQRWHEIEAAWRGYVATLSNTQLNEPVVYVSLSDNCEHHTPLWVAIMTYINHGTDHRAQILALIHALGGKTVEQDIVFYAWERLE
jgi:uncharacterized damage-inducible protein DinB